MQKWLQIKNRERMRKKLQECENQFLSRILNFKFCCFLLRHCREIQWDYLKEYRFVHDNAILKVFFFSPKIFSVKDQQGKRQRKLCHGKMLIGTKFGPIKCIKKILFSLSIFSWFPLLISMKMGKFLLNTIFIKISIFGYLIPFYKYITSTTFLWA